MNCRGAGHRCGQVRLFGCRLLKGMLPAAEVTCRRPGFCTQGGCASGTRECLVTDESDMSFEEFHQALNLTEGYESKRFIYGAA